MRVDTAWAASTRQTAKGYCKRCEVTCGGVRGGKPRLEWNEPPGKHNKLGFLGERSEVFLRIQDSKNTLARWHCPGSANAYVFIRNVL